MSDYDVSIVIPNYNNEKYIIECLESVTSQITEYRIEVLIYDDNSSDSSPMLIEKYIAGTKKDNIDFRFTKNSENVRQGTIRNRGIKESKGETILFLDSDDMLSSDAVEISFNSLLQHPKADIVHFEWEYYYQSTGERKRHLTRTYSSEMILTGADCEKLLTDQTYFSVNKLYRKSFIIENQVYYGEGYIYEDFEFFTKVANRANEIVIIHDVLYLVRNHDSSTTKSFKKTMIHHDSFLVAINRSFEIFQPRAEYSQYYLSKYFLQRSIVYGAKRVPKIKNKIGIITKTTEVINKNQDEMNLPPKCEMEVFFQRAFYGDLVSKSKGFTLFIDYILYYYLSAKRKKK